MSDCFDHEADAWDSYDREYNEGYPSLEYKPKRNSCKYCGTTGLEWRELSDLGWRLCDTKTGHAHNCTENRRN